MLAYQKSFKLIKKSFNKDGDLIIRGVASTNTLDREGEAITITPNALKNALPGFYQKNSPVLVEHGLTELFGQRPVGKVLNMEYSPEEYNLDSSEPLDMEITAVCIITDAEAIKYILEGVLGSFSLGWHVNGEAWKKGSQQLHTNITIDELTICEIPVNPDANFTIINTQEDDILEDFLFKEDEEVEAYESSFRIKSLAIKEGERFYELENQKLKSVFISESKLKAYKTNIDETNLNQTIKQGLRKKIKDESYNINNNELVDFTYSFPRTKLIFGKANNRHSTEFSINSSGEITFYTKITNAEKKGLDGNLAGGGLKEIRYEKNKRPGRLSEAQTPAGKDEMIQGSDKNPKGSATTSADTEINLSEAQETAIENKVKEHNEKYPDNKVTKQQLKKVWRRGAGAFSTTHRPNQTRSSWAMARVNTFLDMVAGKDVKDSYREADGDLLKQKAVNKEELDEVFGKYHDLVNMSYSELKEWSENPKSKLASLDREPIQRNLNLLSKKKEEWTNKDIEEANKAISYISRAKEIGKGQVTKDSEPYGLNEIALRNWAFSLTKTKSDNQPTSQTHKTINLNNSMDENNKNKAITIEEDVKAKAEAEASNMDVSANDESENKAEAKTKADDKSYIAELKAEMQKEMKSMMEEMVKAMSEDMYSKMTSEVKAMMDKDSKGMATKKKSESASQAEDVKPEEAEPEEDSEEVTEETPAEGQNTEKKAKSFFTNPYNFKL